MHQLLLLLASIQNRSVHGEQRSKLTSARRRPQALSKRSAPLFFAKADLWRSPGASFLRGEDVADPPVFMSLPFPNPAAQPSRAVPRL